MPANCQCSTPLAGGVTVYTGGGGHDRHDRGRSGSATPACAASPGRVRAARAPPQSICGRLSHESGPGGRDAGGLRRGRHRGPILTAVGRRQLSAPQRRPLPGRACRDRCWRPGPRRRRGLLRPRRRPPGPAQRRDRGRILTMASTCVPPNPARGRGGSARRRLAIGRGGGRALGGGHPRRPSAAARRRRRHIGLQRPAGAGSAVRGGARGARPVAAQLLTGLRRRRRVRAALACPRAGRRPQHAGVGARRTGKGEGCK